MADTDCPVVEILSGKVKGRACSRAKPKEAKQVFRYAGIPFAEPPVGELRFEPPKQCRSWSGIREAIKICPSPMQDEEMGNTLMFTYMPAVNEFEEDWSSFDEDCLYLNVFTSNPNKGANMPVLFWIYGGGFQFGGMHPYNAQVLCGLHDVVVIMANYRVNVFGFFSTGKGTDYPGNVGLLDQVMALEWTRDNIKSFGGNPNNVTLIGQSAGSMSISLHKMSPLSKGLFHKTIQQSGNYSFPGIIKKDCSDVLKAHKEAWNLNEDEINELMKKLKSFSSKDLLAPGRDLMMKDVYFSPCVDGIFLSDDPDTLAQKGAFDALPAIIGCNSTEGDGVMNSYLPPCYYEGFSEGEFDAYFKFTVQVAYGGEEEKFDKAFQIVKSVYRKVFPEEKDKFRWSKIAGAIQGDAWFVVPAIKEVAVHAKYELPTYFYMMKQKLLCSHNDEFSMEISKKVGHCECDHGDDVVFTFGVPLMNGKLHLRCKFNEEEEEFSKLWMTYITNFAATGNPNTGRDVEFEWPTYESETKRHLAVKIPLEEGDHLMEEARCMLWEKTLPAL